MVGRSLSLVADRGIRGQTTAFAREQSEGVKKQVIHLLFFRLLNENGDGNVAVSRSYTRLSAVL